MKQQSSWASLAGLKTKKRYLALALASVVALAGCDNTEEATKNEPNVSTTAPENQTKTAPVAEQKKAAPKLSTEEMVKNMQGKISPF